MPRTIEGKSLHSSHSTLDGTENDWFTNTYFYFISLIMSFFTSMNFAQICKMTTFNALYFLPRSIWFMVFFSFTAVMGAQRINYTEVVNGVPFTMVRVQGGTFDMGCNEKNKKHCYGYSLPRHQVTLSDFCIGETEVTQALWQAVMGENPSFFADENSGSLPVEYVSWYDVQKFITKLNAITGKNYRLPTEAEWEFAARGGTQSQGFRYSGGNEIGYNCPNNENFGITMSVCCFESNELGLYDMSGNVREWCSDWFGFYVKDKQTNPIGPEKGLTRVARGQCRGHSAYWGLHQRTDEAPFFRSRHLGFRLASQ